MDSNRKSNDAGFQGKTFYFDLENCPQLARQLRQHIPALGGVIKDFLDQRVKYIVTNRPRDQWPPKSDAVGEQSSTTRQSLPTALEPVKDQSFQSPINLNKNSSFSRGKLLLSAIAKSQQTTAKPSIPTDVLERGRHWNITILKAQDVLAFCLRYLSPAAIANKAAVTSAQIKRLKGFHIKVEDNRLQHKPTYKEFTEWPQINFEFQEIMCPFLKKKAQRESKVNDTVESLEGLAFKNRLNDSNTVNTTNHSKTTAIKDKLKSPPNGAVPLNKNLIKKRRPPAFCEICGVDYDDLIEHLKSGLHESYTKNEDNFKELQGVIQSLPPFHQSLTFGGKRIQFDDTSDNSDNTDEEADENEMEEEKEVVEDRQLSSPFQSTPNMSTTIQLNGSNHKSHFVSIHTLIGSKCAKQVIEEEVEDEDTEMDDEEGKCDQSEAGSESSDTVLVPPSVDSPDKQTINKLMRDSSQEVYS